jgi:ribosomal protein S18 acetylase RimI-like enzyme
MEFLPWDSQFFGVTIGRAEVAEDRDLEAVIAAARESEVACLYVVVPGAETAAVEAAIRAGSILTALRLVLEHQGEASLIQASEVRRATVKDSAQIMGLSAKLAPFSRFAQDERFERERIEEMYRIWALNCLRDGEVFVGGAGHDGMLALARRAGPLTIDLVYVDDAARGTGLGRALLDAAVATAGGHATSVVTDVRNLTAVRLYESAGFRARSLDAILHLWVDG